MKYIAEFRDGEGARHIAANIKLEARADKSYHFMEFAATTHTPFRATALPTCCRPTCA